MKTLKFTSTLVPLILSGEKTSTWRLFDDKDLCEGDECIFLNRETGEEVARARLTRVYEKKIRDITNEDYDRHERYTDVDEMIRTFQGYYGDHVTAETMVKIVTFELI